MDDITLFTSRVIDSVHNLLLALTVEDFSSRDVKTIEASLTYHISCYHYAGREGVGNDVTLSKSRVIDSPHNLQLAFTVGDFFPRGLKTNRNEFSQLFPCNDHKATRRQDLT